MVYGALRLSLKLPRSSVKRRERSFIFNAARLFPLICQAAGVGMWSVVISASSPPPQNQGRKGAALLMFSKRNGFSFGRINKDLLLAVAGHYGISTFVRRPGMLRTNVS
jgi:hypothetical protein